MIEATIQPQIFGGESLVYRLEGGTIAEMLGEARDIPGLGVYLEGQEILPGVWHVVTPKAGTHLAVTVPVHGGGGKGGGKKNALAVVASLVVVVAAAAVSAGALAGPLGIAAIGKGTLGAAIAGAAVGVAGNLAIAALFPAPGLPTPAQQDEGEKFEASSIAGNRLQAGGPIPRVIGTHLVSPPLGGPPSTRIVDGEEEIEAFFVLAGPHKIENVLVNGSDIADADGVEYETREGWDSDTPITLTKTQAFAHNVGQELSRFKLKQESSGNVIETQTNPADSEPNWHRFTTRSSPDQFDLRVQIVSLIDNDTPGDNTGIPFRLRFREKGDTVWVNMPEFWFSGRVQSVLAREIRIIWGDAPERLPDVPSENGMWQHRWYVPAPTVTTTTNLGWTADSYFETEQIARPDADEATGSWSPAVFSDIDEDISIGGDDALAISDAVGNSVNTTNYDVRLSDVSDPGVNTDHIIRVRWRRDTIYAMEGNVALWEGVPGTGTLRATLQVAPDVGSTETTDTYTLSASEADAITDYTDLYYRIWGRGTFDVGGTARSLEIEAVEFEVPPVAPYAVVAPDRDGVSIYLDPAVYPKGTYEFEIKRGQTIDQADYTFSSYVHDDTSIYSLFEAYYKTSANQWEIKERNSARNDKMIVSDAISRWNEHPMPRPGLAAVAIRGRAVNINSFSVVASGYVRDWSGRDWDTWKTTSNPAPHYRDILVGLENANPMLASQIDNDTLVAWRAECIARGYRCDMVVTDDSVGGSTLKTASAGFAVPRSADTWAVAYERDRSADVPRQIFTPWNSRDYSFGKAYDLQPGTIKSSILDRDDDYRRTEILTANTAPGQKALLVESIDYPGLTSEAQITKRVNYDMAQIAYRGLTHTITIPTEFLMSRKGDLVGFETDVLSRHLDVREVTAVNGADITLNDTITYLTDAGLFSETDLFANTDFFAIGETSYAAIVNKASTSVRKITAWDSGTKVATLASAPTDVSVGDRFIIGLGENVYRRMLIRGIQPLKYPEARIEMVDEAPAVLATLA